MDKFVLATGGGVLESEINRLTLKRDESLKVYLERPFDHLRINE
jgi:shikimate kinase